MKWNHRSIEKMPLQVILCYTFIQAGLNITLISIPDRLFDISVFGSSETPVYTHVLMQ